jgi:antitoxin ParD1/3/4
MSEFNFEVPDQLRSWIEAQVAGGDYADAADYLRDLVRRDRAASDRRWLKAMIDDGLASGVLETDALAALDAVIAEDPDLHG